MKIINEGTPNRPRILLASGFVLPRELYTLIYLICHSLFTIDQPVPN